MDIFSAVVAAATVVIAFYAWQTHRLTKQSGQRVADLYQAIVVATLIGAASSGGIDTATLINRFKNAYSGKTAIFPND